ncbi:MAG: ribbon-helix-helix protein, CopG family [Chloroflexi bacterium]|nr:ribbon-helix-helix protein, CopG family [Chloroflexota bacterium]
MRRTNIYLDEDQLRALKHVAAEERESVAALVRRAVDAFLADRFKDRADWGQRLDALVRRIQSRLPAAVTSEEIGADITAARKEVRQAHRAVRETNRARGR